MGAPDNLAPLKIISQLDLLEVQYWSFDHQVHQGQLVVHKKLKEIFKAIFAELFALKFPIEKIIPISKFDGNDELSMLANNSSAFNYRFIKGTKTLSQHAYGLAVDINPRQNPWLKAGDDSQPVQAVYNPELIGTLTADCEAVNVFKKYGFTWGGDWLMERGYVDYQHFEYRG